MRAQKFYFDLKQYVTFQYPNIGYLCHIIQEITSALDFNRPKSNVFFPQVLTPGYVDINRQKWRRVPLFYFKCLRVASKQHLLGNIKIILYSVGHKNARPLYFLFFVPCGCPVRPNEVSDQYIKGLDQSANLALLNP